MRVDEVGTARLWGPGLSMESLLESGFHPLRRAGERDVLVYEALARVVQQLLPRADEKSREALWTFAQVTAEQYRSENLAEEDLRFLDRHYAFLNPAG